jgi:hypothetical protein
MGGAQVDPDHRPIPPCPSIARRPIMAMAFKVGDHVSWNSEAGRVSGRIVKVHTEDVNYKGYTRHASKDDPSTKSRVTEQTTSLHKGRSLRRLRD